MSPDLRARVLRLLTRIQWGRETDRACPDCGGWQPPGLAPLYGHRSDCELAAVIDALWKPERIVPQPPPRYDAVYAEGIRDLEEKG